MQKAISQLYHTLPKGSFKIGTTDRGKEFACYGIIQEALGLPLYFADTYSSWQRGSQEELTHILFLINSRPRKCLGWKSPIQVFLHEVARLT